LRKKADEDDYMLGRPTTKPNGTKSKKRSRAETPPQDEKSAPSDEEERPPAKKQKDKEEKPPVKKQKDEEVKASKPLNIPVDEDCPLASKL
jgi:hypothetical protein